jgi:tRNA(fMet)-specific endonuclease VapC
MNLLDTTVCIDILRDRSPAGLERLDAVGYSQVAMSSISAGELFAGAMKSSRPRENLFAVGRLLSTIRALSFDGEAARHYGFIRAQMERRGERIGDLDTLIASHAVALGAVMVTSNTREFARVPGLVVEDWTK